MDRNERRGTFFTLAAFAAWGLFPLYWKLLAGLGALEILAHRIVWALAFCLGFLKLRRQRPFRGLRGSPRALLILSGASLMIGVNWGVYIWAINSGQTVEASLGYYMNPLFSVFLGLVAFKERLSPARWVALGLACAGVALYALESGSVPAVAIVLMASFGLYGLLKKLAPVDALGSLAFETAALLPLAAGYLAWGAVSGAGATLAQGPLGLGLLVLSGLVTLLPLWWFAIGAKAIPLSSVGFLQFLSPSIQLAIGVLVFGEPFGSGRAAGFGLIWAALLVYAATLLLDARRARA